MQGHIIIRGLSDEEIREKTENGDPAYNAGFSVLSRCRLSRGEKVSVVCGLIDGLDFSADDKAELIRCMLVDGAMPPWASAVKTIKTGGSRKAEADG